MTRRHPLDDLDEDIRDHIERETQENVEHGMALEDAHRAALRKFGGIARTKEDTRAVWIPLWLEQILQDVRFGARTLRKSPSFTVVAILTLALGIGANTALFTIVDQVLLRLLPVDNPRELVSVASRGSYYGATWGDGSELSFPLYAELRDNNQVFTDMFARFRWEVQATAQSESNRVWVEFVTGSYFPVLGVNAASGRALLPSDDAASERDVVVLSHRYWRTAFGADPAIVGTTIAVNNHALTIVGVAEEGFDGTMLGVASHMFVPIRLVSSLTPLEAVRERPILDDPRIRWAMAFGRLQPGIDLEQAQAQLQPLYAARMRVEVQEEGFAQASDPDRRRYLQSAILLRPAGDGRSPLRQQFTRPLSILMAIVVVVLLIACANLANLSLARTNSREREFALRLALGAGRGRLVRQLLVESVLLAVSGGMLGLVMATWGVGVVLAYVPDPGGTLTVATTPDGRILAFTVSVAVLTGIVFGLAPALRTGLGVAPALKNQGGTIAGGGYGRLRRAFMVAQIALSLLLLVGAGLFVRSLSNLLHTNLGIDTTRTLSFRIDLARNGYAGERGKAFLKQLRERLAGSPGISNAAFATQQLLGGGGWSNFITIEGQPFDADRRWWSFNNAVSPGFFGTMGIPILEGRDFDARDERTAPEDERIFTPRVAIANRTFVERYLAGRSALGTRVGFGRDPGTPTPIEIVGVVEDAKYTSVRDEVQPQLYFSLLEGDPSVVETTTMYVRAAQDAASVLRTVQELVRQLDPAIPIFDARTLEDQVARSLSADRLVANLAATFGALATLLAMIGLYGVLAYSVARRTREIGVRIALGARTRSVSWLVLKEAVVVLGAGAALALPAAWALTRLVENQLYGVTPMDPAVMIGAMATTTLVVVIAALLPARRAARIDPVIALRTE